MTAEQRQLLREQTRFFYDLQRLRVAAIGRAQPTPAPTELSPPQKINLRDRGIFINEAERVVLQYITEILGQIPIYRDYLLTALEVDGETRKFKGLGPTMAAVILSEFDIHKAVRPSQFWSFAGLAPTDCKRCSKCHIIAVLKKEDGAPFPTYSHGKLIKGTKCELAGEILRAHEMYDSSKTKKPVKGQPLPYNSWLRSKLIGVLAPSLIKSGSPWRKLYDDKKAYYIAKGWGISDGHRHSAAMRYMIKMLLLDIWKEWRRMENFPVCGSYAESKLGLVHGAARSEPPIELQRAN